MFKSTGLSNYLQTSSIHGLKYLSNRCSIIEKIFWLICIAIAAFVFSLLISETTSKFMTEQIVIKLSKRQYAISEIPFPSMTICPEVKIPMDFLDRFDSTNFTKEELDLLQIANLVYDQNYLFENISSSTENFVEFLYNNSQLDLLMADLNAEWRYQYLVPWNLILTKWGFCLNFNLVSSNSLFNLTEVSEDFHFKEFGLTPGVDFKYLKLNEVQPWRNTNEYDGLHIKFFKGTRKYVDSNPFQPFIGYRIIFHSPYELPSTSDFKRFQGNNQFARVPITPEFIMIDDEVRKMSIAKRNCFLENERKLKYFTIYTKSNCEQECLSLGIAKKCHCVPFYLIRSRQDKICGAVDKLCYTSVMTKFQSNRECNCLDQCDSIRYQVTPKLKISKHSSTNFGFSSSFFYPMVKHRSYGFSEYVAAFGGLMGLIGGLSVISLIELCFYLGSTFASFVTKKRAIVHPEIENIVQRPKLRKFLENENRLWKKCCRFFNEFLDHNSIHGLSFISKKEKSLNGRAFWSFVVILSLIASLVLIKDKIKNAELNPVSFDVDVKFWNVEDIPFPAITYCPDFDIEKLYEYDDCVFANRCINEEVKNLEMMKAPSFYCLKGLHQDLYKLSPNFTFPNDSFVKQLEIFTRFDWMKNQSFCWENQPEVKFSKIITRNGYCFSFNSHEDIYRLDKVSENYRSERSFTGNCRHVPETAPRRSFHIELSDFRKHKCKSFLGTLFIHHPNDAPEQSIGYLLNSETQRFIFKPQIVTTENTLRRFDPKIRNCYFEDERPLMFYKLYTQRNCLRECHFNFTKSQCGCIKHDNIRDKETSVCSYKTYKCGFYLEIGLRIKEDTDEYKTCNCLPSCNSISYAFDRVTEAYEAENTSRHFHSSSASFFFSDNEYIAYRRYASYGTVDFLSNIGGLLGLFLGMSLLSVIESIYFFTVRLVVNIWLKR